MNAARAQGVEGRDPVNVADQYAAGCSRYYAGEFDEAESSLQRVVAVRPDDVDALYLLARTRWKKRDLKGALTAFQSLLSVKPDYASALTDLALLLLEGLNDPEAAERFSRRAVSADPLYAPGFVLLGNSQQARGDLDAASASYGEALRINPRLPDPLVNLGVLSHEKGDIGRALLYYERALRLDPSHANAHWNRGNALLSLGKAEEGWKEYEYRFLIRGPNASRRDPERARASWDGSPFHGKTLLVYCEQGLGDTLQFVRYVPLLRERGGGNVIVECQPELSRLLRGFPGIDELVSSDSPVPRSRYDFAVPLLSLPGIFLQGGEGIPWTGPYIAPDPEKTAYYADRFDPQSINVGIVWAGNPRHRNDAGRSCRKEDLVSLSRVRGVQLYSLQKHSGAADFALPSGIIDLGGELDDFSVTAAIIEHLDILVTVDTAAAHLAGAMGKRVWVLLPRVPDWRWQMKGEETPWYPSMKLFRQDVAGDWRGVVERVVGEIPSVREPDDAEALFVHAAVLFRQGDLPGAEEGFRAAIRTDASHAGSHNALGVVLTSRGAFTEAATELEEALNLNPCNPESHYNLGNVRMKQLLYREAEFSYRAALEIAPDFVEARVNLGNSLKEQGDLQGALAELSEALAINPVSPVLLKQIGSICTLLGDEEGALQAFESALEHDPGDAEIHAALGRIRKSRGALDDAASSFRRATEIQPEDPELFAQLGNVLMEKGAQAEAYTAYENALRLKPDFPEVLNNLGMLLKEKGKFDVAEKCYRIAMRVRPEYPPPYNNLGTLLLEKSLFTEAESSCRRALELKPDFHLARNNLANALAGQGRFKESERLYRETIAADPSIPEVHFNLASSLANNHRFDESIRCYDDALRVRPEYAEAHLNRALISLLTGNLAEGWAGYEWRTKVRDPIRLYTAPESGVKAWDGSDIQGKRILVRSEQGFGDTLQFSRFLPFLNRRGGRVVFECHSELCGLYDGFPGVETLLRMTKEPPKVDCDLFVHLLSLPGLLGIDDVASIPWSGPYILPDEFLVKDWRTRIRADRLSVGVVWAGNPIHRNDYNRSCPLEDFLPLLETPGVNFYSLQKGKHAEAMESADLNRKPEGLGSRLTDFSQTAAAIENLDIVIAVDTAVAHLAGAMGKTVWTLLPYRPDWRWLLGRSDSPWYPTMRLFRQSRHGDWPGLISGVRSELCKLVESAAGNRPATGRHGNGLS